MNNRIRADLCWYKNNHKDYIPPLTGRVSVVIPPSFKECFGYDVEVSSDNKTSVFGKRLETAPNTDFFVEVLNRGYDLNSLIKTI
ncbi:MAG: hypothetical protein GY951_13035 [Psychromonas sp.]|nr:hypothetical protein [Alteromonadales bacterium]MCP5078966.1 hypothetical protein [Psychromonas sp.]